jgi:hypothetical protein
MLGFEQFVESTAEKGGSINTLFEQRLFALVGTLERIAGPLADAKVPYEVIGGMAVMIQVNRVEPSAVRNTKNIDILIHRADLDRISRKWPVSTVLGSVTPLAWTCFYRLEKRRRQMQFT